MPDAGKIKLLTWRQRSDVLWERETMPGSTWQARAEVTLTPLVWAAPWRCEVAWWVPHIDRRYTSRPDPNSFPDAASAREAADELLREAGFDPDG